MKRPKRTNACWALGIFFAVGLSCYFASTADAVLTPLKNPLAAADQKEEEQKNVSSQREDSLGRTSPRGLVTGFLSAAKSGDIELAMRYFDMRSFSPKDTSSKGPDLVQKMKVVLDRQSDLRLDTISDLPEGELADGWPPSIEVIGVVKVDGKDYRIALKRLPSTEGSDYWVFSETTVWTIPTLYKAYDYGLIQKILPRRVLETEILRVKVFSWICFFISLVISYLMVLIIFRIVLRTLNRWGKKGVLEYLDFVRTPIYWLFIVLMAREIHKSFLVFNVEKQIYHSMTLVILFATWLILRSLDYAALYCTRHSRFRSQLGPLLIMPSINRALKFLISVLGVSIWLQLLGVNVTAILTGLGIGGVAVALASQKSIEDLFGAVTILSERPFQVGDVVKLGDKIGTVEGIDLRYTYLRTLGRTVISIPNSQLAAMQVENFARRDQFWYHPTLSLRYETTTDQMQKALDEIRVLIEKHPKLAPEAWRVRFTNLASYSLDVEISAYFRALDYPSFLEIAESLNIQIMKIIEKCGAEFAFPSQTVYLEGSSPRL